MLQFELDHLCEIMHDAYEKRAAEVGWTTQPRSRVAWVDVPLANKQAMRAGVMALLTAYEELRKDAYLR